MKIEDWSIKILTFLPETNKNIFLLIKYIVIKMKNEF